MPLSTPAATAPHAHPAADVLISEVGPRDGLQSVRATMATAHKFAWLDALHAAGLREIEVASFVPARLLPQMADAAAVVRYALTLPGLTVMALVPNLRGAAAALQAGVHKLTIPVSASAAHSLANVRRTREQMVDDVRAIAALRDECAPGVRIEANISTAFGCTIQGVVDEDDVVRLAEQVAQAGADESGLSDTTGMANPAQVRRLFKRLFAAIGARTGAAHMHNTRGLGLANCLAAWDVGVRSFDASQGGLGGCPYAPGASGNVVTEDLVFMFEAMGVATGVDLVRLVAARDALRAGLPGEPLYGMTPEAGLPKGFVQARRTPLALPLTGIQRSPGELPLAATLADPGPLPLARVQAGPGPLPLAPTLAGPGPLPLAGVRVVEFTHMVMGPTCGMILADLGAEVIKVEPLGGDNTRRLLGSGAGFFAMFNRNKKSIAVDVKTPRGQEVVLRLVAGADVFSENFKAGAMEALGFGPEALARLNPRLIHVSHKGFLPGPYAHRTALDEVVQMMGGLAYMTGPVGRPLRAGSSVNDIMGGMFGAIGALAALQQRDNARNGTGRGHAVQSALFENNVFLVAQHMMQFAVTGQPAAPMPSRISAWALYDVFTVAGGAQIFLAAVSDRQWSQLCAEFDFDDLRADARLASNNLRVVARDWLMPLLRQRFAGFEATALARRFESRGLPYAPITRPEDLFDDPHLLATGGLAAQRVPADGSAAARAIDTRAALLPLTLDGHRLPLRQGPPALGAHTIALLHSLGYSAAETGALLADGVVRAASAGADADTDRGA